MNLLLAIFLFVVGVFSQRLEKIRPWGFNNDMDLAIAIRTAVVKNNTLYVQSGAGIVADSDPTSEWQETQNKARAVVRAAQMVQEGLDR